MTVAAAAHDLNAVKIPNLIRRPVAVSRADDDEPSYDPVDEMDDAIDARRRKVVSIEPLPFLFELMADGDLTRDQRDAGEILYSAVRCWRGETDALRYRDAHSLWADVATSSGVAKKRVDDWIGGIATTERRRAVVMALVAAEPVKPPVLANLIGGLDDIAARLWGAKPKPVSVAVPVRRRSIGENDATPERLRHANDNDVTPDGARIVRSGINSLHARGKIDSDRRMNEVLFAAALRYQSDHHRCGFDKIAIVDPNSPRIGGSAGIGLAEHAMLARSDFRKARNAMGPRYIAVVDAIVLRNERLEDVGVRETKYTSKPPAQAVASERLNAGLRLLAAHYRLLQRRAA